jgi:hypothetical protein
VRWRHDTCDTYDALAGRPGLVPVT